MTHLTADVQDRLDATDESPNKRNQAQKLIDLAQGMELWHDETNDAFATLAVDGHREHHGVRSRDVHQYLIRSFYEIEDKPPSTNARNDALSLLEARARLDGPEHATFRRVAELDGCIYLDICDPAWRAIEISTTGWRVVSESPIRFTRVRGMTPLPRPAKGGSWDQLWRFVNVSPPDRPLVAAWLVAALRPRGPYPVLQLTGEQGTAKSTAAKIFRSLIDPSAVPLRSQPKDERDLMIAARNAWVLAFDNLSKVTDRLSDGMCRIATGGGFATRELYSDTEETLIDAQRPIVINGISDLASREDLLERALIVSLEPIPDDQRRTERELWAEFDRAVPGILGCLLDAVSTALRRLPTVELGRMPRMADFAEWAVAAEPGLGLEPGDFLRAYDGNREDALETAIEDDPIASTIRLLMSDSGSWTGIATELLGELAELAGEEAARARSWPKRPRALSDRLRRAAPSLRRIGITIERDRQARRRLIVISRERGGISSSQPSQSSQRSGDPVESETAEAEAMTEGDAEPSSQGLLRHTENPADLLECDVRDARDAAISGLSLDQVNGNGETSLSAEVGEI